METTETYKVFYPDGTSCATTGGQDNVRQFTELAQAARNCNFDLAMRADFIKQGVSDYADNNLVNACLIQFPYGRGGMQEVRMKYDGSFTDSTDVADYIDHLSRISQPHFHEQLFSLIMYNLKIKQNMVRRAGWRVRNKADAAMLAEELTMEDVNEAISSSRTGRRSTNPNGRRFLEAIDAIAASVPHTNAAAKRARRDGESMQHHFGCPTLLLTVTPDDESSILVQVYSDFKIDDGTPVAQLTDEQLIERAEERTKLRLKYPGITAFTFECLLDIIIEEVVGWDRKKGRPREDDFDFFLGVPDAFTASMEEQGRLSLHTHIQVWIRKLNQYRENLHASQRSVRQEAEKKIALTVDRLSSSKLITFSGSKREVEAAKTFPMHLDGKGNAVLHIEKSGNLHA